MRLGKRIQLALEAWGLLRVGPACGTCGMRLPRRRAPGLPAELVAQWELTPAWARWFGEREGSRCSWCRSSLRSGQLAAAIVREVNRQAGTSAPHLRALFSDRRTHGLAIAEINSAGQLHRHLARCPGLRYSEYGGRVPGVPSEDLHALSYPDASFDLGVTSDTLEHVPDLDAALRQIFRVLRPGGAHVFSAPVVWDRQSRRRAELRHGALVHLLPASHHGDGASDMLVFHELGADFAERCRAAGFELDLLRDEVNPALVTFTARRPEA